MGDSERFDGSDHDIIEVEVPAGIGSMVVIVVQTRGSTHVIIKHFYAKAAGDIEFDGSAKIPGFADAAIEVGKIGMACESIPPLWNEFNGCLSKGASR